MAWRFVKNYFTENVFCHGTEGLKMLATPEG
jgi:hypothetical protein